MDISLSDVLHYVHPIGEELQHQTVDKDTVCLHSDVYILTRLSDLKLSQNMVDIITNRLQEVKDTMPDNLRQSFDKLNDFEKMDLTDSRYQQWLSDRLKRLRILCLSWILRLKRLRIPRTWRNLKSQYGFA